MQFFGALGWSRMHASLRVYFALKFAMGYDYVSSFSLTFCSWLFQGGCALCLWFAERLGSLVALLVFFFLYMTNFSPHDLSTLYEATRVFSFAINTLYYMSVSLIGMVVGIQSYPKDDIFYLKKKKKKKEKKNANNIIRSRNEADLLSE